MDKTKPKPKIKYPIPNRRFYPIPEVRVKLGDISHAFFYKLVSQGVIRLTKMGNRSFVTDDEIDAVVARLSGQSDGAHKAEPAPEAVA